MVRGALTLLCLSLTATAAAAPDVKAVETEVVIAEDQVVQDVVLIDAKAKIHGVVRGHVYALGSTVDVESSAIVLKSITLYGGALRLTPSGVLPPTIDLHAADLLGTKLQPQPGKPVKVKNGATTITRHAKGLTTASAALMKSVLGFDRLLPGDDATATSLRGWHPGLGMAVVKAVENAESLTIGGLAKLRFVSDKIAGSFQRGYVGERGNILVSAVHLVDDASATALWDHIEGALPASKVTLSVKSGLRDGAHWFFRHDDRYCMLWQRGRWFFSVETRLAVEDASIHQQKQFSEQVLAALGRQLDAQGGRK